MDKKPAKYSELELFSAHDPQDPSQAPEVAPSSTPIALRSESEAPQAFEPPHYYDQHAAGWDAQKEAPYAPHDQAIEHANSKSRIRKYKRALIIGGIVVGIVAAAIVGAAVGVGVSRNKTNDTSLHGSSAASLSQNSTVSSSSSGSVVSATSTTSSSPSSSSSAPAASGTTGLAAYDCTQSSLISSSSGTSFKEECNTQYAVNHPDSDYYNTTAAIRNLPGSPFIRYNMQKCLDRCDQYNSDNPSGGTLGLMCRGVTYYANLTQAFNMWDKNGNCFLKSGRGGFEGVGSDPGVDWAHTESAYMACLGTVRGC